ncbi:ABC transporter permease [Aliiglaciecola sp. CAU 1673]|uniref:ABC transporter permease n=1 Tax=Aliiglaciecola sp. CAU 1673 TaxID=3032595 RepID=UPI0023DA233C|nr:ABC transporter permease [Aliiglaciecola sp. CAU 1673]MDF2179065.1 ABC transporter permease [Aliiglaciecola sp. CAU 1673]
MAVTNLIHEFKLAYLSLKRAPGFVAIVVATLSITLGALLCIFNLNHLLLTKAFPYPDADKLMVLDHVITVDGVPQHGSNSIAGMQHLYKQQNSLESMALVQRDRTVLVNHQDQPRLSVRYVTPEYFQLVATPMALGRPFSQEEGIDSGEHVAVMSFRLWQEQYQGRADIIGSKLQLGDNTYRVVGVAAENFQPPQLTDIEYEDIWLSWDNNPHADAQWGMFTSAMKAIAVLEDGVSHQQAQATLSALLNDAYRASGSTLEDEMLSVALISLEDAISADSQNVALLLLAGALALLLIATANVTNLFLSRAAQKRRMLAIQASLGARTQQLFRALFAESLLLCLASTTVGLLMAGWGFVLLQQLAEGELPRLHELSLDVATLVFSVFVALVLALLFAWLSRSVINFRDLREQLQSSGKGSGVQIDKKVRSSLVIAQVSLACVLLIGSTMVMQQALQTIEKPLGFNTHQLYHLRVDPGQEFRDNDARAALSRDLKSALQKMPQVAAVSRSIAAPIREGRMSITLSDENMQRIGSFRINLVDENYFNLLQLPMAQGRGFQNQADDQSSTEMVVSESLANILAPEGGILGKVFKLEEDQPMRVVGVVKDYFNPGDMEEGSAAKYYLPHFPYFVGFDIKVSADSALSKQQIMESLAQIYPKLRIEEFIKLDTSYQELIYRHKVSAALTLGLTLLALLLAGAGIYGVLSYSTQMRRYELGIHMALGAKTHQLQRKIMLESLLPVALGLLGGLLIALLAYGLAKQQLSQLVQPNVLALLSALPLMSATAALACYLPVRRVIVQDPVKALRNE